MSKEKQIDDKDLDKISGAGDLGTPATHLSDTTHDSGSPEPADRPSGSGGGGSGPGGDTDGTDGGGLQDLG